MMSCGNMKIALILFEISKIGGILTFHKNIKEGLECLGHKVTDYYISLNKSKITEQKGFVKTAGFYTNGMLKSLKNDLRDEDLLIFSHPCPTITKEFNNDRWKEIYKIGKPIITVFHDPFLEKYYPWILCVKEYIVGCACVQKKSYDVCINYFPNIKKIYHPMILNEIGFYDNCKEDLTISPHQFKTWKHIDFLIRVMPKIRHKVEVYNTGIEYYYMAGSYEKRKEKYKDNGEWIWDRAIDCGMDYKGYVSNEEIEDAYKRTKCVVDMSTGELGTTIKGEYKSVNYAVLEAMKYGAVPIVRNWSLVPNMIEKDNCVVIPEHELNKELSHYVNFIIETFDDYGTMRKNNFKLLIKKYDCKIVAGRLLSLLDTEGQDIRPKRGIEKWL